jgi:hypothetical protein
MNPMRGLRTSILLALVAGAAAKAESDGLPTNLPDPDAICARFHSDCGSGHLVERNSTGTELRLIARNVVIVVPEEGPAERFAYAGPRAWLDDRHVFAGALDETGALVLASGDRLLRPVLPEPFDWARRYALLESDEGCRIVRTASPGEAGVATPAPCRRIFAQGERVYVVGDRRERTELVIASFRDEGGPLVPLGVRTVERPSGRYSPFDVVDVSLDGTSLAVHNEYDAPIAGFAPSYLVPMPDGALERQPFSRWGDFQLFLSERLARRLEQ